MNSALDYKRVKMTIYLNDKKSYKYMAILPKDFGLPDIEKTLATSKVLSFPYFKLFSDSICYITFKCDAIKYISMESSQKLSDNQCKEISLKIADWKKNVVSDMT